MNGFLKTLKANFKRVPLFVYVLNGLWAVAFMFSSNYLYYFSKNLQTSDRNNLFFNSLGLIFIIEIAIVAALQLPFFQNMRFSKQVFIGAFLGFCLVFQVFVVYLLVSQAREGSFVAFLMNCFNVSAGLLFLGGTIIAIKNLSWKMLPLLLLGISGLVAVFLRLASFEVGENIYLLINSLFLIAVTLHALSEREVIVKGFKQIAKWFKARFTNETIR